ncbi:BspA family leucine-rich repeat surface protein, partial [Campylobacter devanensis]|uniref:BspA family leucine-rich repeat surface protein n=1 Tax=Campylobacter devanensis TaxID=3161138 RepID=UPI001F208C2E
SDIELSLSSYTLPLKEINNEILKAKELESKFDTNSKTIEELRAELVTKMRNRAISQKTSNPTEYKYHPKTKEVLRKLVSNKNVKLSEIDISEVSDFSYLFKDSQRSNFSGIEEWDVSHVTNMSGMFYGATSFNQSLYNWDVSNVVNMSHMFYRATSFNQPLNNWDVSNVTDMSGMFYGALNFNSDISSWDVSNVTNMSYMFYGANSFNQSLDNWDVSNVKNMENMFFSGADVVNTLAAGLFSAFGAAMGAGGTVGASAKQQPPNKKRLPKWYKK